MPHTTINPRALEVQARFFEALKVAIQLGRVKDLTDFCTRHHLNRAKYSRIRGGSGQYKLIDIDALSAICQDFDVSPTWLLMGRGKMLSRDENTVLI